MDDDVVAALPAGLVPSEVYRQARRTARQLYDRGFDGIGRWVQAVPDSPVLTIHRIHEGERLLTLLRQAGQTGAGHAAP